MRLLRFLEANWAGPGRGIRDQAAIAEVTVSSLLTEPDDPNAYSPLNLFDGDLSTGWFEAVAGPGVGQYIEIVLAHPVLADGIQITPGWFDEQYWENNHRIARVELVINDVQTYELSFPDTMDRSVLSFREEHIVTSLRLAVLGTYESNEWDDTGMTEIELYRNDAVIPISAVRETSVIVAEQ